jgi:hypothetical protein
MRSNQFFLTLLYIFCNCNAFTYFKNSKIWRSGNSLATATTISRIDELRGYDVAEPIAPLSTAVSPKDILKEIPSKGLLKGIDDPSFQKPFDYQQYINVSSQHLPPYQPLTWSQKLATRFRFWKQFPWRKISSQVILKIKISGTITLESPARSIFWIPETEKQTEELSSLAEIQELFLFAANDPRVEGILLEIGPVSCGYGKLFEIARLINYFKQSSKLVFGYSEQSSEKELFLLSHCQEYFMPPEGTLDLRGLFSSLSYYRNLFQLIGIEPQVQRHGKYKSYGDMFNRTDMSEPQREVMTSLLLQSSAFWVSTMSELLRVNSSMFLDIWKHNEKLLTSVNQSVDSLTAAKETSPSGRINPLYQLLFRMNGNSNNDQMNHTSTTSSSVSRSVSKNKPLTVYDYQKLGLVTRVLYYDQLEKLMESYLLVKDRSYLSRSAKNSYLTTLKTFFLWFIPKQLRPFPQFPILVHSIPILGIVEPFIVKNQEDLNLWMDLMFLVSRNYFYKFEENMNLGRDFEDFPRRNPNSFESSNSSKPTMTMADILESNQSLSSVLMNSYLDPTVEIGEEFFNYQRSIFEMSFLEKADSSSHDPELQNIAAAYRKNERKTVLFFSKFDFSLVSYFLLRFHHSRVFTFL